ncbi:MAG: metal-dependent hydrolase [Pseudomonadales bacterium]
MSVTPHPMDEIPVRQLRFKFDDVNNHHPVWSNSCPEFAMFINALGVHVPYFERFLVKVMREYRGEVADPKLQEDIKNIIGQEAHHAFNFVKWNEYLVARYPELEQLEADSQIYFTEALDKDKRFKVGFTAGYETFTFLAGLIILDRYQELMADADPILRALWVWHQVEEVEHGAVAFEFYKVLYGDHEWYRKAMVMYALSHIIWETFKAYKPILKKEGYNASWGQRLSAWKFFSGFAWDFFRSALPVFKRDYHPRNHPICTSSQNPIAIAWREYHKGGGNTEFLSDDVMAQLTSGIS